MATASGAVQPRKRRFSVQEQDWDTAPPKKPQLGAGSKCGGRRLIVVLEGASLETVKVVLNSECGGSELMDQIAWEPGSQRGWKSGAVKFAPSFPGCWHPGGNVSFCSGLFISALALLLVDLSSSLI